MQRPSSSSWRPLTTRLLFGGFFAVLVAIVVSYAITTFKPTTEVRISGSVLRLWVAADDASRYKGLSGVTSMRTDGGLLMDHGRDGQWGIVMREMHIPLDIVWLSKDKKVVHIVKNASPSDPDRIFSSKDAARYVLELNAGVVDSASIKIGQTAEFTIGGAQ